MADQDFNIKVVTTANTAGVQQTTAAFDQLQAKIQAAQKAASVPPAAGGIGSAATDFGRIIGFAAGGAVYQFLEVIKQSALEIEKVSTELQKQGNQISENAQKFSELAKFSTTQDDVLKIGEGALKGVETAHKNLLDISGKELTTWQKIVDIWAAGFKDKGPIAQALELQQAQAAQNYQMERTNAIQEITSAQRTKDDLAAKSYADKVAYLTDKIDEQDRAQRRAGVSNVEDYLKAGAAAENYRKILAGIKSEEDKSKTPEQKSADKTADNEAAKRKARDFAEVKAYGRILSPQERANSGIPEDLNAAEKQRQASIKAQQDAEKAVEEQTSAQSRGITVEQLRNERSYLGKPQTVPNPFLDANYKTPGRIARESADRAAAEANQRESERFEPEKVPEKPPQAHPVPLPSPDVVKAIENLGNKLTSLWT